MTDFLAELTEAFAATLDAEPQPKTPALVTAQIERGLLPEDVRRYMDEHGNLTTTVKAEQKDIRLLRERHHSVARLVAEGVPQEVVAAITQYTAPYISTLLQAPAMVQLVEHYRSNGNAAAQHIGENLRVVAGMSLERLREKVEMDQLSNNELLAAAKLGYDRSGHGPSSSLHAIHEHHLVPPEEIAARHAAAKLRDKEYIIHPEQVRPALQLPAPNEADAA